MQEVYHVVAGVWLGFAVVLSPERNGDMGSHSFSSADHRRGVSDATTARMRPICSQVRVSEGLALQLHGVGAKDRQRQAEEKRNQI